MSVKDYGRLFCTNGHSPYEVRNGACRLCAVWRACSPATTDSDAEIAARAGVGERTVRRLRTLLEQENLIEVVPPKRREIRVVVPPPDDTAREVASP